MSLRRSLTAGILLILFSCLSVFGQRTGPRPNFLITANSAGDVHVGMTIAEARKVLAGAKLNADPSQSHLTRYEAQYTAINVKQRSGKVIMSLLIPGFDDEGHRIPEVEDSEIAVIKIWDSRYRTANGVHPGMTISNAEHSYGKITEIFGFYGDDESAQFRRQPNGFEFLVEGKGLSTAGFYEDGRDDFAEKYTLGAYISSISISGENKS